MNAPYVKGTLWLIVITLTGPRDEHPAETPLYIEKCGVSGYALISYFLLETLIDGAH